MTNITYDVPVRGFSLRGNIVSWSSGFVLFAKKILLEETCIVPLSILRCMNRYVVRRGWSTPRERSLEHLLLFNFNSQLTNIQQLLFGVAVTAIMVLKETLFLTPVPLPFCVPNQQCCL